MLDLLKEHHGILTKLLDAQNQVKTDDLQMGVRTLMQVYAAILKDGISTLGSLIEFLDKP